MAGYTRMKLQEYADREMMMMDVANVIAGELNSSLMNHEHVSFAVPGGTTPGPMFESLCAATLDWPRVHVMLTDERWVPEDDPRSNTGLLQRTLFADRARDAVFIPFYMEGETAQSASAILSETLKPELPLSVLLLGMGTDMHTASLFPGAEGLTAALDAHAPAVMPIIQPGTGEPRVTLSGPVLANAMATHILITGADKREAVERAARLDPAEAPVRAVLSQATIHWAE